MDDVLTHDERLHLECVAQAIAMHSSVMGPKSAEQIVQTAKEFAHYIQGDTKDIRVKSAFQE